MEALHTVYLSTGSNIGDRRRHLDMARREVALRVGEVSAASGIYRTAAWGLEEQPDFLNQVLQVATALDPVAVLDRIQAIEQWMGRERKVKWGTRVIDIDILFYDDLVVDSERLTIPHPLVHARRFVLIPLREIAPSLEHPGLHKTVAALTGETTDALPVELFSSNT